VSDATRDLYERFSGQIFGYCFHQLGSREEAEDAVQTTFMNAFRGLQRGIVPRVESAWLFKIAHNVCLSRRRSTRRRGNVEAPNNFEVLQEVVPAQERNGDELIRLQDALERMPETQRRAILLREWQGLSYREIADELDISQSAVETLIFRARRSLASGLDTEPAQWRKRARRGLDVGTLGAALKGLLSAGTAAKVAATIAVATTAAVAVSDADQHSTPSRSHVRAPQPVRVSGTRQVRTAVTAVTPVHVSHGVALTPRHVSRVRHASDPLHAAPATSEAVPTPALVRSPRSKTKRALAVVRTSAPKIHGLAKGHEKHAQPKATPAAMHVPPVKQLEQKDQPNAADQHQDGGHGNSHGSG
jgi:RNA polymerase sigma factor (sigma-70 family)